jgi:hypothetical protein
MGLIIGIVSGPPASGVGNIANYGLASGVDVHMLNPHGLIATSPQLRESLCMLSADPEQLQGHVAIAFQHWDMLCPSDAGQKRHGELVGGRHLNRQHSFNFVLRRGSGDHSEHGVHGRRFVLRS